GVGGMACDGVLPASWGALPRGRLVERYPALRNVEHSGLPAARLSSGTSDPSTVRRVDLMSGSRAASTTNLPEATMRRRLIAIALGAALIIASVVSILAPSAPA